MIHETNGLNCNPKFSSYFIQFLKSSIVKSKDFVLIDNMNPAYNSIFGRYSVAAKDLKPDELIFEEIPFAFGPKQGSPVICLGCYKPLKNSLNISENERCLKCKWPLCSECQGNSVHQGECEIFLSGKVKFHEGEHLDYECIQLECITPLRVLLKKESNPERWEREVEPMEYHDEARKQSQETWNADLINIAKYLRGPCKLSTFSEELIMRVVGILQVNAFEAKTPHGYPMRCLFPQTGILAHNCVPNTVRTIYPSDDYRIKVRALIDIKKDSEIFVSYTYVLDGTADRQQHLKQGKYFICHCERCTDPTELGTNFSSVKCKECESGYLTVIDPLDKTSNWKCSKCDCMLASTDVNSILEVIQREVNTIEEMPYSPQRLECTERIHGKLATSLHPMHYIQTSLRQSLIHMYGRVKGFELSSLPEYILEYKIELCRLLLKILDKFEPGVSRSRAAILYELHAPIALLAQKLFLSNIINAEHYKMKLEESISTLEEAAKIFQHEDSLSLEGMLAVNAKRGLEHLRRTLDAV